MSDKKNKAVALQYNGSQDLAPKVKAKGQGKLADQIIMIAKQNGIEVRSDHELVELLSIIDIDEDIPVEAFAAVAEILVYLYKTRNKQPSCYGDVRS